MARPKKEVEQVESTHIKHTINGLKVNSEAGLGDSSNIEIIVPKDMPYVKVRKALELALLRIR